MENSIERDNHLPVKQGLYDPVFEHDACGVGFVCDIKGKRSNDIVRQGLEVLRRLSHRGATGADPKTGDGAGILIQMPHEFLIQVCAVEKIDLPEQGFYGSGLVFLPTDAKERKFCKDVFLKIIEQQGQLSLGWRKVPVDNSDIGKAAKDTEPVIEQIFIARGTGIVKEELDFERKLYIIRKKIENEIRNSGLKQKSFFYITNMSCRTLSYKGLLMPEQLNGFFLDLKDERLKSSLSLVHSRYSTNTFPTWDLSQPFRFLAHNGEINTLRGNINWMRAREGLLRNPLFGKEIKDLFPVIVPGGSDSAALDNVFELLVLGGRPIEHVMSMLIPSAWQQNKLLDNKLRDFYKYHACLTEPWDGPAAVAFTDGKRIGAVLDRNGLRPARYLVTKNNLCVMASEVGVLDIKPEEILISGRLEPGKMFFIDTELGQIVNDKEIKDKLSSHNPYGTWIRNNMLEFDQLPFKNAKESLPKDILAQMKAFGYTREDLKTIIKPMAETAQEPIGAMGNDAAHAVLSNKPQLLYNYFKQLFAQVTNPPIDPIREELVMSLETFLGPEKNIFQESPKHCHKLRLDKPILTNNDLERLKAINTSGFKTKKIPVLFRAGDSKDFSQTLGRICHDASAAIKQGYTFVLLTDRGINKYYAALPMLLAVSYSFRLLF